MFKIEPRRACESVCVDKFCIWFSCFVFHDVSCNRFIVQYFGWIDVRFIWAERFQIANKKMCVPCPIDYVCALINVRAWLDFLHTVYHGLIYVSWSEREMISDISCNRNSDFLWNIWLRMCVAQFGNSNAAISQCAFENIFFTLECWRIICIIQFGATYSMYDITTFSHQCAKRFKVGRSLLRRHSSMHVTVHILEWVRYAQITQYGLSSKSSA